MSERSVGKNVQGVQKIRQKCNGDEGMANNENNVHVFLETPRKGEERQNVQCGAVRESTDNV